MGGKNYGFDLKCMFLSSGEVFLRSVKAYRVVQVQRMILVYSILSLDMLIEINSICDLLIYHILPNSLLFPEGEC